jgi:osmotically-inducible protein OsmY
MDTPAAPVMTDNDLDLEAAVRNAVMALDGVRPTRSEVNISVSQGQVTLTGVVPSPMTAAEVEVAAASVPGVMAVTNRLVDDGTLSRQVAEALALDERTRSIPPGYRVAPIFGTLLITGYFTPEQGQAVEAVAGAVPGVREVIIRALN